MRRHLHVPFMVVLLSLCLPVTALADHPTSEPPKAVEVESVLTHIPTGAMGYLLIPNLAEFSDNLDGFIGALQMPVPVGDVVGTAQMQMMLGEGFNPNGGLAVVLLDTQAFGIDLAELIGADEAEEPVLPLVFFVPGDSIEGVFGNHPITAEGAFSKVDFMGEAVYAATKGDYVVLSPRTDALQVALDAKDTLASTLRPKQLASLAQTNAAVHMDIRVCRPVLKKALEKFAEEMEDAMAMSAASGMESPGMDPAQMAETAVAFYGALLDQTSALTIRAYVDETGIRFGETISFEPDSDLGKLVAAQGAPDGPLLDRLPDLPYFLAFGSNMSYSPEMIELFQNLGNKFVASLDVPEDVLTQMQARSNEFYSNVKSVQFVLGGAPKGSGTLGMSLVYVCEDAEAIKATVAEQIDLAKDMMAAMAEDAAGPLPELTHSADALTVGGVSVDRLTVDMPESDEAELEEMDAVFTTLLGSETLDILIAAPDKETLVFTIGGGEAMMAQALTVADGSGEILASDAVTQAMGEVPDDAWCVGLFNLKNLGEVIATTMEALEPGSTEFFPLMFMTSNMPIMFFAQSETHTLHADLVIPAAPIADAMQSVMQAMAMSAEDTMEDDGEPDDAEDVPEDDSGF